MYPETNPGMLQLLTDMLEFNPYFRPTAKECLSSKLFDSIRVAGLEASAPFKINIDVDRNEYKFDYEEANLKFTDLDHSTISNKFKEFVLEEVLKLKEQA